MLKNISTLGKSLNKMEQQSINGGVQGPCTNYCVPKFLYDVECIAGWCHYTPVGP